MDDNSRFPYCLGTPTMQKNTKPCCKLTCPKRIDHLTFGLPHIEWFHKVITLYFRVTGQQRRVHEIGSLHANSMLQLASRLSERCHEVWDPSLWVCPLVSFLVDQNCSLKDGREERQQKRFCLGKSLLFNTSNQEKKNWRNTHILQKCFSAKNTYSHGLEDPGLFLEAGKKLHERPALEARQQPALALIARSCIRST